MFRTTCVSSLGRPFLHAVFYATFFVHLYEVSSKWKDVFEHILPLARLKIEKCAFCCLHYIILLQCTVQKKTKKYSKLFSILDLT